MSYSISFSKAVLVVIFIADKTQQGMFDFLSSQMISDVLSIPKPTLVKILQSLTRVGIIETKEGKNGGIRLLKKPSDIKVLDIFEAVEEGKPLFHTSLSILAEGKRPDNALKSLVSLLNDAEVQMKNTLNQKTIEEILNELDK
jgi:Rrf2 family protein